MKFFKIKMTIKLSLYEKIDYGSPINIKKIERDNLRIYKSLINIYTRKPLMNKDENKYKVLLTQFQQSRCLNRYNYLKRIQDDNLRLFLNLLKVKPDKNLTKKEYNKHWQKFLLLKSRRFLNINARIKGTY